MNPLQPHPKIPSIGFKPVILHRLPILMKIAVVDRQSSLDDDFRQLPAEFAAAFIFPDVVAEEAADATIGTFRLPEAFLDFASVEVLGDVDLVARGIAGGIVNCEGSMRTRANKTNDFLLFLCFFFGTTHCIEEDLWLVNH